MYGSGELRLRVRSTDTCPIIVGWAWAGVLVNAWRLGLRSGTAGGGGGVELALGGEALVWRWAEVFRGGDGESLVSRNVPELVVDEMMVTLVVGLGGDDGLDRPCLLTDPKMGACAPSSASIAEAGSGMLGREDETGVSGETSSSTSSASLASTTGTIAPKADRLRLVPDCLGAEVMSGERRARSSII